MMRSASRLPASLALLALASALSGSAAADSLVQTQSFSISDASAASLPFAGFDPASGTLENVEVSVSSIYFGDLTTPAGIEGSLQLGVTAPHVSLTRSETATCGVFGSCPQPISGAFSDAQSFVNPYLGVGQTAIAVSAATGGDASGSWSGSVGLEYVYLPSGGGSSQNLSQSLPFSLALSGPVAVTNLLFSDFDPALGNLLEVALSTTSSYSGSVDTTYLEDPDIDFAVAGPLLGLATTEDVGPVCGNVFLGGCSDSFTGGLTASTQLLDGYLGTTPVPIGLAAVASDPYTGTWSGSLTLTYEFTPVPEPGTLALTSLGLLTLAVRRQRRGRDSLRAAWAASQRSLGIIPDPTAALGSAGAGPTPPPLPPGSARAFSRSRNRA